MPSPLLVSVHIPKCGGSTLLRILAARFGDRLQRAYQPPRPGVEKTETDGWPDIPDPACIHGHAIDRYLPIIRAHPDVRWITFLRDPLAGAVSFYHFRRRRRPWGPTATPFVDRGLEAFLLDDYNHNRYTRWFARLGLTLDTLALVGITEQFDDSMRLLFHRFAWAPIPYTPANVGPYIPTPIDRATLDRFATLNAADHALYESARARLRAAMAASGPTPPP